MENSNEYLMVKWRVKEGYLKDVLQWIDEMGTKSVAEEGNTFYHVHQSIADPNVICLYESYSGEEAIQHHKESDHYKSIVMEKIIPLLEEREVIRLKPLFI